MENLDEQFILLDSLMEPPTIEQELELEKKIRWFTDGATKVQLIKHCEAIERSQFQQAQFIANCLTEIARCKAKIACMAKAEKQPPPNHWIKKMFGL